MIGGKSQVYYSKLLSKVLSLRLDCQILLLSKSSCPKIKSIKKKFWEKNMASHLRAIVSL